MSQECPQMPRSWFSLSQSSAAVMLSTLHSSSFCQWDKTKFGIAGTHHNPLFFANPLVRKWSDWGIRVSLQDREVVEWKVGLQGREIDRKSRAVSQRPHHRGLTWAFLGKSSLHSPVRLWSMVLLEIRNHVEIRKPWILNIPGYYQPQHI